jgi:hypothetical protein
MSRDETAGDRTIRCAHEGCRRVIYPGRSRRRKYCSEACKQAAYRTRQREIGSLR